MKKTENRKIITGLLAAAGSTLTLLPILAPVIFSIIKMIQGGPFMLDYLMPAELFPVAILGGVMLIWAAARARSKRVIIGWSSAIAIISLIGGQLIAVITGLASGATKADGWQWALVLLSLFIYTASLGVIGITGIILTREQFQQNR